MTLDQPGSCMDAFSDMGYWKWEGVPSEALVRSAVGFMERVLEVNPEAKLLDLGCGLGLHAIELVRRGYQVTAMDCSEPFLADAKRRAAEAGVTVHFVHGDMSRMGFDAEFDAVVLWGNTFGMLSDEDNRSTLLGISRGLRQGGLALIDTQNYTALPGELKQSWSFSDDEPNLLFLIQDTKDVCKGRFGFDVIVVNLKTGDRHTMPFSWRLYLLPELERLLTDAGLHLVGVYGDDPAKVDWAAFTRGDPYPYSTDGFTDSAAKRILLCQKRAA